MSYLKLGTLIVGIFVLLFVLRKFSTEQIDYNYCLAKPVPNDMVEAFGKTGEYVFTTAYGNKATVYVNAHPDTWEAAKACNATPSERRACVFLNYHFDTQYIVTAHTSVMDRETWRHEAGHVFYEDYQGDIHNPPIWTECGKVEQ